MITPIKKDPLVFRWPVINAGYRWATGQGGSNHLIPRDEIELGMHLIEPHSGLFLEFAKLKPALTAIGDFACKYGDLFNSYGVGDFVVRNGKLSRGASEEKWRAEIQQMSTLVGFWEDIKARRVSKLKEIVTRDDKGIDYLICGRRVMLAHAEIALETPMSRFAPSDILLPAKYALQKEINRKLREPDTLVAPQLSWTPDNHQRIVFRPSNLLAAMWLQFAQAVTEEFQLQVCEGCGKYFQVGPGGRRADAKTCSDACRQRKNRA
jgi:hypothetical protein